MNYLPHHKYEKAGQLLELSERVIRDKADGVESPEAELVSYIVKRAAEVAATGGIDRALGFIDGWWYAAGNEVRSDGASNNETWRAVRKLLGEPVR